jgi:hypothetical protein
MKIEKFMPLTFGHPQSIWDRAKQEAREHMIDIAKKKGTISYGQLATNIKTITFNPHDDAFHKMLGQICVDEESCDRGMLSVVVVHASGDMQPGPGFFDLAQQLGRNTKDKLELWS